jgi:hypothetical protein
MEKPATEKDERVLPSGILAEEFYTDQDLQNGTKDIIEDLKDKALTLKKPSQFGASDERRLKSLQEKYEKGEISKDTYESILEIIDKKS